MSRKPIIRDRHSALMLGIAAQLLAALLLWDAYENRGKSRPFWMRPVSGLT